MYAVARADSYRLITAVAVICNWIIENVDIKTAFLNGNIDCNTYIKLPDGRIGKLLKSLYGLKQAPKIWYDTLNAVLTGMGFITLPTDASVYVQSSTHDSNGTGESAGSPIPQSDRTAPYILPLHEPQLLWR
jgi:hypothetical protein